MYFLVNAVVVASLLSVARCSDGTIRVPLKRHRERTEFPDTSAQLLGRYRGADGHDVPLINFMDTQA